ncbi:hypothetical protein Efla_007878 [Eimeria flavescens]
MDCLGLFLPQHLASLLLAFARWRVSLPPSDFVRVVRRLAQLSHTREETGAIPDAAAAAAAATAAAQASFLAPQHPLFSSTGPAAASSVSLDWAARVSCLFSLGVLVRPCCAAAAAAAAGGQQQLASAANSAAASSPALAKQQTDCGAQQQAAAASSGSLGQEAPQRGHPAAAAAAAAAKGAAACEAVDAAERLFGQWIGPLLLELSLAFGRQPEGEIQPLLKLAEAVVNCASLKSAQQAVGPLQQLLLQRHRSLDPVSSSKLLHLFRLLGLPEGHDLLLLLQQQAEQAPGVPTAAAAAALRRGPPLTIRGQPAALHAADSSKRTRPAGASPSSPHAASSSSATAAASAPATAVSSPACLRSSSICM